MKPYTWSPDHTLEQTKDGAYWERNMLALTLAQITNSVYNSGKSGWYRHGDDSYTGWSRVISIANGHLTFHVPDDFDLGDLPEIEPNWDGHTTEEKWNRVMKFCRCKREDVNP